MVLAKEVKISRNYNLFIAENISSALLREILMVCFLLSIIMKKQTVDSISKQKQVELRKLAQQIFADQLEREQSDKLWLLFAKGLALFVVGYMAYHFIRFLMM